MTCPGIAAQAYCGEIVKPTSAMDEIVDPIKISDNTREVTKFFREGSPVPLGVFNYLALPCNSPFKFK